MLGLYVLKYVPCFAAHILNSTFRAQNTHMKRRTVLLFAILGLVMFQAIEHKQKATMGRNNAWSGNEQLLIDLHIPDAVITYQSPLHVQVPSTGISMVVPEGYARTVNFMGFRKDKDTCIDVIEDHTTGIGAKRRTVDSYISYLKKDRSRSEGMLYRKDFKFNGYDAFIICVSDTTCTRTAIYMVFGDDGFNVAMTGTLAENTEENRAEIVNTMLTACYHTA